MEAPCGIPCLKLRNLRRFESQKFPRTRIIVTQPRKGYKVLFLEFLWSIFSKLCRFLSVIVPLLLYSPIFLLRRKRLR